MHGLQQALLQLQRMYNLWYCQWCNFIYLIAFWLQRSSVLWQILMQSLNETVLYTQYCSRRTVGQFHVKSNVQVNLTRDLGSPKKSILFWHCFYVTVKLKFLKILWLKTKEDLKLIILNIRNHNLKSIPILLKKIVFWTLVCI